MCVCRTFTSESAIMQSLSAYPDKLNPAVKAFFYARRSYSKWCRMNSITVSLSRRALRGADGAQAHDRRRHDLGHQYRRPPCDGDLRAVALISNAQSIRICQFL